MEHPIREYLHRFNMYIWEINELYHQLAIKTDISDSVQCILYLLYENGGECLQSTISKQSGMSRQTVNTAIRNLQKQDILAVNQGQGRNTVVSLTEKGWLLAQKVIQPMLEIEVGFLSEWSEEERETFLRLNQKYRDGLKNGVARFENDACKNDRKDSI